MLRPILYQVVPTDDFKVYLYYDNGEIKLYDCNFIFDNPKIYQRLLDNVDFKNLCTIMNRTLAFDISKKRDPYNCIDFCPDTIYNDSISINRDVFTA